MIPRMYGRPSKAPADACTRVSARWDERDPITRQYGARMCSPMNPAWLRKQSKRGWTGACHEPRQFATYVWCQYPAEWSNWDQHWAGRKGTGPYRNGEPCTPKGPRSGMLPDVYAGTELGYDGPRIADADPYTYFCYTHFCTENTRLVFMGSKWDQPGPEWVIAGSATCAGTPPRPQHP